MGFNPNNFDPAAHGSGGDEILPVATYILWVRSFKRRSSNGKDQIMFIIDAIAHSSGKVVPKDRFSPIFETITLTANAAWRLADLCQAIGQQSPFNAMSDGEVASVFRFKPFKAKVKHETWQGNESAKLDGFFQMSGADERIAEEVLQDRAIDGASGGGYDESDPGGSYGGGYQGGGDDFSDDDIPF
jgi:hypothetical protein